MEETLDLYATPYDPKRPKVNFDESSKQLIKETRTPLPALPGHPERFDHEYERNGTRNLFLFVEPRAGWRHVEVTDIMQRWFYFASMEVKAFDKDARDMALQSELRTEGLLAATIREGQRAAFLLISTPSSWQG